MTRQKESISWENETFQEALDSWSGSSSTFDDLDSVDEQEIANSFKKTLGDYKRILKRCTKEGVEVSDELESYKEEYFNSSPTISKRLDIISGLREQIQTMISACDNPPKDIIRKYSEDLVDRIEKGIIDGFEISEY